MALRERFTSNSLLYVSPHLQVSALHSEAWCGEGADRKKDSMEETIQEGVLGHWGGCECNPEGWDLAEGTEDSVTVTASERCLG